MKEKQYFVYVRTKADQVNAAAYTSKEDAQYAYGLLRAYAKPDVKAIGISLVPCTIEQFKRAMPTAVLKPLEERV